MTPFRFFLFRLFNLTFGRFYKINNFIRNRIVVKYFIMPNKKVKLKMKRKFIFLEKDILIEDLIFNLGLKFKKFKAEEKFTTIFMASSKYYQKQDLIQSKISENDYSMQLNNKKMLKIIHKISI